MKTFLTSVKGKIIAGALTAAVVAVGVVAIVLINSGYRTIVVDELNGTTNIVNNTKESEAYVGQHLVSGDDVTVMSASDLTLALDMDKYVFAEENTHFWIEAKGKLNDTRTDIFMDAGSNLFRIDQKLGDDEEFKVDTPNSTLSVRGTVFRVSISNDANGDKYTLVEVLEGEVYVEAKYELGKTTGENITLHAGESIVIRSNSEISEFVKAEDGKIVSKVQYGSIPQKTAKKLGIAMDEGRKLSITKELLFDLVQLTEHQFDTQEIIVEATCDEAGSYYEVCSICGIKSEEKEIPRLEHEYVEEVYQPDNCMEEGYAIRRCTICDDEIKSVTEPEGHVYADDDWTIVNEATCSKEGLRTRPCLNCGRVEKEIIKKEEHDFGIAHIIMEATDSSYGLFGRTCSKCSVVKADDAVVMEKTTPKATAAPVATPAPASSSSSSSDESSSGQNNSGGGYTPDPGTPSHTHSWVPDNSRASIPATCLAAGERYEVCSGCSNTQTVTIPIDPSAHNYVAVPGSNTATCVNGGDERQQCSVCSDTISVSTPATGHIMTQWSLQDGATSMYERDCSVCWANYQTQVCSDGSRIVDEDGDGKCDACRKDAEPNGTHPVS